jgi:hypothetical protein
MRSTALPIVGFAMLVSSGAALSQAEPEQAKPEKPEPPSAELLLSSATSGISAASWVNGYTTESCEEKEGEGRLATFNLLTKSKKSVRIGVGVRYYIVAAAAVEPPVGAQTVGKTSCRSMISFVPEVNHSYEVIHDLKTRNCPIILKDAATGAEVPMAQKHKAKGLCKEKEKG